MPADDFFADHLETTPVIGIFRGSTPTRTIELCQVAWNEGVELVEVPVQTPEALPALEAAVAEARKHGKLIGAGTVTHPDQVDVVERMGATFVISPGLHPDVAHAARQRGLPYLPGVATSTEVAAALRLGLTWLKAFPAAQLTPGWVSAQLAPFPHASFVATGGVDATNVGDFLASGCRAVAVGSAFHDPSSIAELRRALSNT